MNRVVFTSKICILILQMVVEGENPILDYGKRSDEEQARLFEKGFSECDGVVKISDHQIGRAEDIYFLSEDATRLADPIKGWEYWHKRWEDMGGKSMISWDKGHFAG